MPQLEARDSADVPRALAELHHATAVGDIVDLSTLPRPPYDGWRADIVLGGGFEPVRGRVDRARRVLSLPDTVGPGMRLLVIGLNPSIYSAERGIGFARPGNRYWPAALASGIVSRDRDPMHALTAHKVGMTDLVKRPTARADELSLDEYRAGMARIERISSWLEPAAVCFVGLSGYRAAVDRGATAGWLARPVGGRPAYLMPNPSGLNAHATPALLAEHLSAAAVAARD